MMPLCHQTPLGVRSNTELPDALAELLISQPKQYGHQSLIKDGQL